MKKSLILFDIDGTLVLPIGRSPIHNRFSDVINEEFGINSDLDEIDINGKTLRKIFVELASTCKIKRTEVLKHLPRLCAAEADYIKVRGRTYRAKLIPGSKEVVVELKRNGYPLGIVTGNSRASSVFKLKKVGLDQFFKIGGFGELSENREDVLKHAIIEARQHFKTNFKLKNVFYIGDAPLDILAGKKAGVNVIAVATGWCTISELRKYKPDFLLKGFSNKEKVLKIIRTGSE